MIWYKNHIYNSKKEFMNDVKKTSEDRWLEQAEEYCNFITLLSESEREKNPNVYPEVVHIKKSQYDIYIGRKKSKYHYGNPFSHLTKSLAALHVESRAYSIYLYYAWLKGWHVDVNGIDIQTVEIKRRQWILKNIHQLKNKRLGCFCSPKPCHGDAIVHYINTNKKKG